MNSFTDEKAELVNSIRRICGLFVSSKGTKTQARDRIAQHLGLKSRRQVHKYETGKAIPVNLSETLSKLAELEATLAPQQEDTPPAVPSRANFDIGFVLDLAIQYGEMKELIDQLRECKSPEEAMKLVEKIKKR